MSTDGEDDLEAFLAQPLVAHVATAGPTVIPVWFLWEEGTFWWLTGGWSRLHHRLTRDSRVAVVIDSCDLATGQVLSVSIRGRAEVVELDRPRAVRTLTKYLGPDSDTWPERFCAPLTDPATRLVRLPPARPPVLRDLSWPAGR